jgi:GrpB-like predicted nucleotidyltransferase (UPF0157 family)
MQPITRRTVAGRLVIYCIVPEPLAEGLVGDLRAHFAPDDRVQVLVDRRKRERRASARGGLPSRSAAEENEDRRSGSDRRRPVLPRLLDSMPPALAERAEGVRFVQRMLPVSGGLTGLDVPDVVARVREGDPEAPTELYWRIYERVHSRLCVLLGVPEQADQAAPVAFGRILDALEDPANAAAPFDALLYDAVDAAFAPEPDDAADDAGLEDMGPSLAINDETLDEMVVVRERDPVWFGRAQNERDKLMRKAGMHLIAAEHIGSTGVPSIAARPIIDMIVGVERMQEPAALRKALVEMGYERCGDAGTRGRAYYRKRGVMQFDLHVVKYDGPLWRDAIAMREFLRRSPNEAAKWAAAKREAARAGGHSLLRYAEVRAPVMRDLQARAVQSTQRAA